MEAFVAQQLSGAGAIDSTYDVCMFTSTAGAQALTLADGKIKGQEITIIHAVDGGSGVITAGSALHLSDSIASITLTNVRDWVRLKWYGRNTAAWAPVGYSGATFA